MSRRGGWYVGAPSFYEDVTRRLRDCDLVVVEGVGGRVSWALTLTYRLFGDHNRDGLVVQHIDYKSLGVPVVAPDLSPAEFEAGWRDMSVGLRLSVYALHMLLFGSREMVARHARIDDLPSPEDVMRAGDERIGPLVELIGDDRDARLLAALERIHDERCHELAFQANATAGGGQRVIETASRALRSLGGGPARASKARSS